MTQKCVLCGSTATVLRQFMTRDFEGRPIQVLICIDPAACVRAALANRGAPSVLPSQ